MKRAALILAALALLACVPSAQAGVCVPPDEFEDMTTALIGRDRECVSLGRLGRLPSPAPHLICQEYIILQGRLVDPYRTCRRSPAPALRRGLR